MKLRISLSNTSTPESLADLLFDTLYSQRDKVSVRSRYVKGIVEKLNPLFEAARQAGQNMAARGASMGPSLTVVRGASDLARELYRTLHDNFNPGDTDDRHYLTNVR